MELAPRIHEGYSEGRTVPGSRANGAHSLGRGLRSNCVSFKTALFPPVGGWGKYMSEPVSKCWYKHFPGTYCVLCIVHFHKQEDVKKWFEMRHELKCLQEPGR